MRRRAVVPSLHRKYIANMVDMFAESALHGAATLAAAHQVHFSNLVAAAVLQSNGQPAYPPYFLAVYVQLSPDLSKMTMAACSLKRRMDNISTRQIAECYLTQQ